MHWKCFATYKSYFDKLSKYEECRQDPENLELLQVRCIYCNNWFNPTIYNVRNRLYAINNSLSNELHFYCSDACKKECPSYRKVKYLKGFKFGTSRETNPTFRKKIFERDNWTCQKCGKSKVENKNLKIHCHHIYPVSLFPEKDLDFDSCITLCIDCHIKIHQTISGCSYGELRKNKKR